MATKEKNKLGGLKFIGKCRSVLGYLPGEIYYLNANPQFESSAPLNVPQV